MDANVAVTSIATVVALVAAIVAIVQASATFDQAASARDSASAAEAQAVDAERSADAAEAQLDEARRAVRVAEEQVREAQRAAIAAEQQVELMQQQLAQSRTEWTEQRVESLQAVVRLVVNAFESWHESATSLVGEVAARAGEASPDNAFIASVITRQQQDVRAVMNAIQAVTPHINDLPFGAVIVAGSRLIGRGNGVLELTRDLDSRNPTDSDLRAARVLLEEVATQIDHLHAAHARWLARR